MLFLIVFLRLLSIVSGTCTGSIQDGFIHLEHEGNQI